MPRSKKSINSIPLLGLKFLYPSSYFFFLGGGNLSKEKNWMLGWEPLRICLVGSICCCIRRNQTYNICIINCSNYTRTWNTFKELQRIKETMQQIRFGFLRKADATNTHKNQSSCDKTKPLIFKTMVSVNRIEYL